MVDHFHLVKLGTKVRRTRHVGIKDRHLAQDLRWGLRR
jgi:hypothetical protein